MFSFPHSPASYNGDSSHLQQRAAEEERMLHHAVATGSSSAASSPPPSEADRSEASGAYRRSSRLSIASGYSGSGAARLSPTDEGSDIEDDVSEQEFTSERERSRSRSRARSDQGRAVEEEDEDSTRDAIPTDERMPLIPGGGAGTNKFSRAGVSDVARGELSILVSFLLPICGTHFLEYSLLVVTIISVGHIGTVELAAASLASMTSNVVALSVIQGYCAALDTLCTQSFAAKPKETSLHALRTFVILLVLLIPQTIVFWNAESILLLLKQDPGVAERAGVYLKVLSFGLPGYAGFECVRRYLQAQGLMTAPTIVLLVTAPLNAMLNYLLVWGPDAIRLGFVGAPLATAISMNWMFFVSVVWTYRYAPRTCWGGFQKEMFTGLRPNIYLGLVCSFNIQTEWYAWELSNFGASYLGSVALASQSVLLTSASLFYQIPYALAVASAVRTGNLLGQQRPQQARISSRVSLAIATVIAIFNSGLLIIFRNSWGKLFSSEKEVIDTVAAILPLVAFFQLTDALSGATGGLLRGAGKAPLGAIINLTGYYIFGLPIGFVLAFVPYFHMGLYGLWIGLSIALTCTAILTGYVVWTMDWEACSEQARRRMGTDKLVGEEADRVGNGVA